MPYYVSTAPASEPVTAADIRSSDLHIDDATEENHIDRLIEVVRTYIERQFDKAIVSQKITETFDDWDNGCLNLTVSPVITVDSISYVDTNGSPQTIAVNTGAYFQKSTIGCKVILVDSPPALKDRPDAITIVYTAGHSTVPEHIKQTIIEKVARMYYMREENTEMALQHVFTSAFQLFSPERRITV